MPSLLDLVHLYLLVMDKLHSAKDLFFNFFFFLNFGEACSQEHFSQSLCTRVLQKLHSAKRFFPPLFKNFGGACSGSPFFSWKLTKREVY